MSSGAAIVLFGPSHLAVLGAILGSTLVLSLATRLSERQEIARGIAVGLVSLLVVNKLFVYATAIGIEEVAWRAALPMHMCDWAAVASIIALLWRKQIPYELAYFWGLAGTLQATLTPDLKYDFPDIRFLTFFISHGGTLVALLFLTFGMRMRPYPISILRVFAASNVYLLCAGLVDLLVNENYGYLRHKPIHASLMDHLGPWPWYILSLEGLALISFLVYYTPFFVADCIRRSKIPGSHTTGETACKT